MPITDVQIANVALSRLGVQRQISSLDDTSQEAIACKLHYAPCRDRLLMAFPWPFAMRVAALDLVDGGGDDPATPDWQYAYRYPFDALKVLRLMTALGKREPKPPPFDIGRDDAGRLILTNEPDAVAQYTVEINDPSEFDPLFASALSWLLASEIAMPLSASERLRERALQMFHVELERASASAGNESMVTEPPDGDFIRDRW